MAKDDDKTDDKSGGKPAKSKKQQAAIEATQAAMTEARARLAAMGRNDPCHCGSGKKYKKCHLVADEAAATAPPQAPDPKQMVANAWGLFELRADKVTDAFTRPEVQPFIRAAHALGCLAYDQERYADACADLERVYSIDAGTVGTEARLITAKALLKQDQAADAVKVLEPAAAAESGSSRARMGLALAHFVAGSKDQAAANLTEALRANPHFAKAVLGRIRRRVENLAGSQPGSIEEALVYAQTYGDVWTDDAKTLLVSALDGTLDTSTKKSEPANVPATPAG
jgi:lipopolysaccharide biosynthesis regulator YciM